ncbi:uncharacterized protein [Henckelia pumila]|uniref:uncharacterized protein n=1 Tax=Henckelia pumila TaxID=405737 RepID=UPI003C6E9250
MDKQSVKDFIHEHQLIFKSDDDEKPKLCKVCRLLIIAGTRFYSCSISSCTFFLHKHCADLPKVLIDPDYFSAKYNPFILSSTPTNEGDRCLKCYQICKNFTYCPKEIEHRNASLHPLCASPCKMETTHRSHRDHPLSPTHREIRAVCNACGEQENGIFFICQQCNYWLHQDCASLPPVAKHADHSHPLALFYSHPFPKGEISWGSCKICEEDLPLKLGVYTCQPCNYGAHIKCMKSSLKDLTPEEYKKLIAHLPPSVEDTVFPSLIIRAASLELEESNGANSTGDEKRMKPEECHDHPLTLLDDQNTEILGEDDLCNVCIQPILGSTPYYSCNQSHCHFLVHELCANLPTEIFGKLLDCRMYLFTEWPEFFGVFLCAFCRRSCNGFGYSDGPDGGGYNILDVECASAPRIIKHKSHKNHTLQLMMRSTYRRTEPGEFLCCSRTDFFFSRRFYQCINCDYKMHISCALLPQRVEHKFDTHPLQLHTDGPRNLSGRQNSSPENYYDFCEICEKCIDLRYWFYGCLECDNYFHVNCIPSVGEFSKFRFGGSVDDVPRHGDHPLTSVRMLTIGSQRCGYCGRIVRGFEDGFAFHCEMCDFWMHEYCVFWNRGYR